MFEVVLPMPVITFKGERLEFGKKYKITFKEGTCLVGKFEFVYECLNDLTDEEVIKSHVTFMVSPYIWFFLNDVKAGDVLKIEEQESFMHDTIYPIYKVR